jgi:hypothetical protein
MIVDDALIPTRGRTSSEADDRFDRLAGARRRDEARRRLRRMAPERLDVLDDRSGWASLAERKSVGVGSIAIGPVTGGPPEASGGGPQPQFTPASSCG